MTASGSEFRRLSGASASLSAATAMSALLSFIFVVIVARVGGPEIRGQLAFLVALPTLLSFSATLGLEVANLFHAATHAVRSSLVTASIIVGTISASVLAVAAWLVLRALPGWIPAEIPTSLVAGAMLTVPVMTVQFLLTLLLVGSAREGIANVIRIAIPTVTLVTFGGFIWIGISPLTSAVGAWIIGQVVGASAALAWSIRAFGAAHPSRLLVPFADLFSYGLPAHGGNLADVATFRVDSLILGAAAGAAELGIYAAAINLAETLLYVPSSVAMVLLPTSVASSDSSSLASQATLAVVALCTLGAAVMIAIGPLLVQWLFGPGFEDAVTPLRILSVAMIGMGLRRVLAAELAARRRQALAAGIATLTLAVIVPLDLVLIPRFGAVGAAWASLVAYLTGGVVIGIVFWRVRGHRLQRSVS